MGEETKSETEKPIAAETEKDQALGLGDPAATAAAMAAASVGSPAPEAPVSEAPVARDTEPVPEPVPKTAASVGSPVPEAPVSEVPVARDTEPAPEPAPKTAGEPRPTQVYEASGVRKTLLSLVFLLLLPFFISLPAMLYQRLTHQLWTDTVGFAIFAGAFALVMLLVVYELIHSLRSRVEINDNALKFTLPAARGVGMPKIRYRRQEIPFSQIDSIEMRREIYGGAMAPVLLRGARIITKDGEKIPLGYISEANVDPTLPLPDIASEVARRVGIEVTDRGNVRREFRRKLRGIQTVAGVDEGIPAAEVDKLNRRHHNFIVMMCGLLFVLIAAGILIDVSRSGLQLGERAATAQPQKK